MIVCQVGLYPRPSYYRQMDNGLRAEEERACFFTTRVKHLLCKMCVYGSSITKNHTSERKMKRNRQGHPKDVEKNKGKESMSIVLREDEEEKEKRNKCRSYLFAAEKKLSIYERVRDYDEKSKWVHPPPSSFTLLQEKHSFDPWRVLVICILLNVTKGRQVEGVLEDLFDQCPNAEAMTKVSRGKLEQMFKPLGLQKRRAKTIKVFSNQYLRREWTHVTELHGIGKYAADAYAIFCVGKPGAVIPEDHKLVDYWKFVCEKRVQEQQHL